MAVASSIDGAIGRLDSRDSRAASRSLRKEETDLAEDFANATDQEAWLPHVSGLEVIPYVGYAPATVILFLYFVFIRAFASPVGVSTDVANGGQATESIATSSLHTIQEEEEMYEPLQANSASVPADDNNSSNGHFGVDYFRINVIQSDEVPTHAIQSNADFPRAGLLDNKLFSGDQSNADLSYANLENAEHGRADCSGAN
ncbi:hypothetical protein B0T13DRAFT_509020 [Neurospora crassa]|nr:hypothetical protein B0T13DRAFT_509020 [Neurospora crassa]